MVSDRLRNKLDEFHNRKTAEAKQTRFAQLFADVGSLAEITEAEELRVNVSGYHYTRGQYCLEAPLGRRFRTDRKDDADLSDWLAPYVDRIELVGEPIVWLDGLTASGTDRWLRVGQHTPNELIGIYLADLDLSRYQGDILVSSVGGSEVLLLATTEGEYLINLFDGVSPTYV